jgi:Holliday junction resolvase
VSASKAKGTAAETAVVRFLQANGYPHAERRALAGAQDRGDIAGIPGLVIEVKNERAMKLAAWIAEADAERYNLPARPGMAEASVVWHKRRGKTDPGDWYVTMTGWAFLAFLEEWADDAS